MQKFINKMKKLFNLDNILKDAEVFANNNNIL